ncbi:hypothetical protein, partial [Staphylococcus epidermidis]
TFNIFNNHQPFAPSQTPITSQISSNTHTLPNQNSTTINNSQKQTLNSTTFQSNHSNTTNNQISSQLTNTHQSTQKPAI